MKNCVASSSEETLKLLISEYQSRLAALEVQGPNTFRGNPPTKWAGQVAELENEKAVLTKELQQFRSKCPQLVIRVKLEDNEELKESIEFPQTALQDTTNEALQVGLVRQCMDTLKHICKHWHTTRMQNVALKATNQRLKHLLAQVLSLLH